MREWLLELDYRILHFLNVRLGELGMDGFWRVFTDLHKTETFRFVFMPGILLWVFYIYRARALKILVSLALAIAVADSVAYRVIKNLFKRARPPKNPEIQDWLRTVGEAHGFSFPSNHAANVFAGAVILSWYFPRGRFFFYTLATFVALSRSILGVHYPSDIFAGACLGLFVGLLIKILLLDRFEFFRLEKSVSYEDVDSSGRSARNRRLE